MRPFESHSSPVPESASGTISSADFSSLQNSLRIAVERMEEQVAKVEENEKRIRGFEEKLDARETRKVEALAIFIALFTLISVNINIFTRVSDIYTAVWFMLLMTICTLIVASALFFFIHDRGKWYQLLLVIIFLIAVTALLVVPYANPTGPELNPITIQ